MASGGRLPAPAGRGPRAAAPALRAAPGPRSPRTPVGPAPWPVPCDRGGPLDERRLVAHLQLALGREARLWRGGQPQVAGRGRGPPGSTSAPFSARAPRPGSTCARAPVSRPRGAGTCPRCARGTRHEAGIAGRCRRGGGPPQSLSRWATEKHVEICHKVRDLVLWLLELKNIFDFSQTTCNLALTTFGRLLVSLKAGRPVRMVMGWERKPTSAIPDAQRLIRERILQCAMITSLRLAAKVNEEEELIPRVKDFLKHYGSGYTPNELLRMELAILDRLHWDLYIATPLDFLTIFHALVVVGWPHVVELLPQRNPSLHVASLTRQLQHCMAGHQLLQFKGSTLALVIITLELERLMPDWCTPISDLLKKAQVSTEQLSHCKGLVKQHLRSL
ncbi:hypothetical protein GH733_009575 [Mirounga leonina]|nr:hypothetical protein GH733_009575 [Mirounga leonina]